MVKRIFDEDDEDSLVEGVGNCRDCRYFGVELGEDAGDETLAPCQHDEMIDFDLTVSGDSGCNLFEPVEEEELEEEDELDDDEDDDLEDDEEY